MKKQFDEWLNESTCGWISRANMISNELAESGADREMDFDIERELEERYARYLLGNADGPYLLTVCDIKVVCDPIRAKNEVEIHDEITQIQQSQNRLLNRYSPESRKDRFFRRMAGQREILVMAGKIKEK